MIVVTFLIALALAAFPAICLHFWILALNVGWFRHARAKLSHGLRRGHKVRATIICRDESMPVLLYPEHSVVVPGFESPWLWPVSCLVGARSIDLEQAKVRLEALPSDTLTLELRSTNTTTRELFGELPDLQVLKISSGSEVLEALNLGEKKM